jgi:hypothetical protein
MDRLIKIDKDEFIKQMQEEFTATMKAVAEAVNAARDGQLINGSEEACREALGEFRRKAYEKAVQMRIAATEKSVAFSPCGSSSSGLHEP